MVNHDLFSTKSDEVTSAVRGAMVPASSNALQDRKTRQAAKVVVTGFEAFSGMPVNPSAELALNIGRCKDKCILVESFLLPACFRRAGHNICKIIDTEQPDILLMFGVDATQRKHVKVEAWATNTWRPDAYDTVRRIHPSSPAEYASRLPVVPLVRALNTAGISAVVSESAGYYVCNYVFYSAAQYIHSKQYRTIFAFVHLPSLALHPESCQMGRRDGVMSKLVRALQLIIHMALIQLSSKQPGNEMER